MMDPFDYCMEQGRDRDTKFDVRIKDTGSGIWDRIKEEQRSQEAPDLGSQEN